MAHRNHPVSFSALYKVSDSPTGVPGTHPNHTPITEGTNTNLKSFLQGSHCYKDCEIRRSKVISV